MSYVAYTHFYEDDADLHLVLPRSAARAIGRVLALLGGGILFAATMYLMIVLPGLVG